MGIISGDCDRISNNTLAEWHKFRNKTIFLTGGTGFFGKWFISSFLHLNKTFALNASMTILSRSPEKFLSQNPMFINNEHIDFITGDMRTFCFQKKHFDFFIHAGAAVNGNIAPADSNEIYSSIVDSTGRVLEYAKYTEATKLLFTSSGAVYGIQPPEMDALPEDAPVLPVSPYGKGKFAAEALCLNSDIDTSIARCFAFVGPYLPLKAQYAIGNFIDDALNNRKIVVQGDGRTYRSYLYTTDLMIWLWTILLKGANGGIYNVGSEEAVSIAELAATVSSCFPYHPAYEILGIPDNNAQAPRYIPSTKKAQCELGLKQTVSLTESIKRTALWNRERL